MLLITSKYTYIQTTIKKCSNYPFSMMELALGIKKDRIFNMFHRNENTQEIPGTRIGLPFSRSLAEMHQGKLELKKDKEGLTHFLLSLPLHQILTFENDYLHENEDEDLPPERNKNHFSEERKTILIVEDKKRIT